MSHLDMDGNCGATRAFGLDAESQGVEDEFDGITDLILGKQDFADLVISHDPDEGITLPEGVDVIAGHREIERLQELINDHKKYSIPQFCLRESISHIKSLGIYDYIFLDTAPNLGLSTIASYAAADYFLLTATPDCLSFKGMRDALNDILAVRQNMNQSLQFIGVMVARADKGTNATRDAVEQLRIMFSEFGEFGMIETIVSKATAVLEAQGQGVTLYQTGKYSPVAMQYQKVAEEMERLSLIHI